MIHYEDKSGHPQGRRAVRKKMGGLYLLWLDNMKKRANQEVY